MIRRMVLLSFVSVGLVGCSDPATTPTATAEPPTATAGPTAEPTVETMSKEDYANAAFAQWKRSADSQTEALTLLRDPKWTTDPAAREEILAIMVIPDEVSKIFKETIPPPGAEAVHAGMVEQTSFLATAMGKIKDAMTAMEAGDVAAAAQAMSEHTAMVEAATKNSTAALTALGSLKSTP